MEAVIFIGIQASGKSTFYEERFAATHIRINLDMLKTRRRELALLDTCIQEGRSFVVDNTNVLAQERERYITRAKQAGYRVTGYFFSTSLKDAIKRSLNRDGKARIPERGVAAKYYALQPPRYEEGFDQLYVVTLLAPEGFSVSVWAAPGAKDRR